jgi:hypothetical protein
MINKASHDGIPSKKKDMMPDSCHSSIITTKCIINRSQTAFLIFGGHQQPFVGAGQTYKLKVT